jgi:hypothetical protein
MFTFTSSSRLPSHISPLRFRLLASLSSFQSGTEVKSPFHVFDRQVKRLQKDRAVACDGGNRSRTVDYVREEVANRMIERFLVSPFSKSLIKFS